MRKKQHLWNQCSEQQDYITRSHSHRWYKLYTTRCNCHGNLMRSWGGLVLPATSSGIVFHCTVPCFYSTNNILPATRHSQFTIPIFSIGWGADTFKLALYLTYLFWVQANHLQVRPSTYCFKNNFPAVNSCFPLSSDDSTKDVPDFSVSLLLIQHLVYAYKRTVLLWKFPW